MAAMAVIWGLSVRSTQVQITGFVFSVADYRGFRPKSKMRLFGPSCWQNETSDPGSFLFDPIALSQETIVKRRERNKNQRNPPCHPYAQEFSC